MLADSAVLSFTAPMSSTDTQPGPESPWKCHSHFLVSCGKKVKLHLFGGCCLAAFGTVTC